MENGGQARILGATPRRYSRACVWGGDLPGDSADCRPAGGCCAFHEVCAPGVSRAHSAAIPPGVLALGGGVRISGSIRDSEHRQPTYEGVGRCHARSIENRPSPDRPSKPGRA